MVNLTKAVSLASLLALSATGIAEDKYYNGEDLKRKYHQDSADRKDFSELLKASKPRDNLSMINEKDIYVKLPNGKYVQGILLPNNRKAPAVSQADKLFPACITKSFELIAGVWDANDKKIKCDIEQDKLAFIEDSFQQGTSKRLASKYGEVKTESQPSKESDEGREEGSGESRSSESLKKSSKYSSSSNSHNDKSLSSVTNRSNSSGTHYSKPKSSGFVIPVAPTGSSGKSSGGSLVVDQQRFGIIMGSWIEAKLETPANSADSGLLEFQVTETVYGKHQSLPAGTLLFVNKSFNNGNRRLEGQSVVAILPDGSELKNVRAYLYSKDRTSGLSGTIIRDRGGEMRSATSNALLNAANDYISGSNSLSANTVGDIGNQMLENEQRYAPNNPTAVIEVEPQSVLFKVARSF